MPASSKVGGGVLLVGGEHGELLAALLELAQVVGADPLDGLAGLARAGAVRRGGLVARSWCSSLSSRLPRWSPRNPSRLVRSARPLRACVARHARRGSSSCSRPPKAISSSAVPACGAANHAAYWLISSSRHSRSNSSSISGSASRRCRRRRVDQGAQVAARRGPASSDSQSTRSRPSVGEQLVVARGARRAWRPRRGRAPPRRGGGSGSVQPLEVAEMAADGVAGRVGVGSGSPRAARSERRGLGEVGADEGSPAREAGRRLGWRGGGQRVAWSRRTSRSRPVAPSRHGVQLRAPSANGSVRRAPVGGHRGEHELQTRVAQRRCPGVRRLEGGRACAVGGQPVEGDEQARRPAAGVRRPVVRAEADGQVLDARRAGASQWSAQRGQHLGGRRRCAGGSRTACRCARSRSKARSAGGLRISSSSAAVGSSGP